MLDLRTFTTYLNFHLASHFWLWATAVLHGLIDFPGSFFTLYCEKPLRSMN